MNKDMEIKSNSLDFLELDDIQVLDIEGSLAMPETGASNVSGWLCCSSSSSGSCCS